MRFSRDAFSDLRILFLVVGLGAFVFWFFCAGTPLWAAGGEAVTQATDTGMPLSSAAAPSAFSDWASGLLQNPLLLCFLIIALGMGLGSIQVFGLSLGSSGVLFSALLLGHLGVGHAWSLPDGMGTLGLVLFVYSVGLGAGPTFFRTFRDQGKKLVLISIVAGVAAAATTIALAKWWSIPGDLASGLFAGAMTSTPGLASAVEAITREGGSPAGVSIGFGMAYPIGVIVTVMFVQVLPKLMRVDLDSLSEELEAKQDSGNSIHRHLVAITNPTIFGKSLHDIKLLDRTSAQITRILQGKQLVPVPPDHVFEEGQVVLLVADDETAEMLTLVLGKPSNAEVIMDTDRDRMQFVVTSSQMLDKPLRELHLRSRFGVTIARIERYGVSFVPNSETTLTMADRVSAVGPTEGLKAFEKAVGHRARRLHETDLMSLGVGLVVGILIGLTPISLPGIGTFKFGMAGGPLLAGLLFSHFGRLFGVIGYMPTAARIFVQQLGLAFFLAYSGFNAGGHLGEMLGQHGYSPFLLSLVVAIVPLAVSYVVARYILHLNALQLLGGACGAMTSTAAIGAVTSKTDSDIPVSSYAAAYPAALVMMTILTQLVIAIIRAFG